MNTKINLQTILIVFMVCVTVIVTANSSAKAQVGGENNTVLGNAPESEIMLDPVPGGPGFIMVSAFDFQPLFPFERGFDQVNLFCYVPEYTMHGYYASGLSLPDRATITKMTMYYKDNHPGNSIVVDLNRTWGGASPENVATVTSIDTGAVYGSRSTTTISSPRVENQNYSYFLLMRLPCLEATSEPTTFLSSVRIDYEYTVYTPTIMK